MSLASMKLKLQLSPTVQALGVVPLEVVAVHHHHHRDNRELNVHLRPLGDFEAGTVDVVLLGDDLDSALPNAPQVGQRFTLTLSVGLPSTEAPASPESPAPEEPQP